MKMNFRTRRYKLEKNMEIKKCYFKISLQTRPRYGRNTSVMDL